MLLQRLVPGVARSLLVMRDERSDISEAVAAVSHLVEEMPRLETRLPPLDPGSRTR